MSSLITEPKSAAAAVAIAKDYYQSLSPNPLLDVQAEEVDSDVRDGRELWLITLSRRTHEVFKFIGGVPARDYKVFAVDKATGEVLSMKIREQSRV